MESIYQDIILEHYKNPHNFGKIDEPTVSANDSNPLCGDELEMSMLIKDNKIIDVKFFGNGCAISQAAASMLTDKLKNKTLEEVRNMSKDNILSMLGVELSAARLKCGLLALKVAKLCVYKYLGGER